MTDSDNKLTVDWAKMADQVPVIIQEATTLQVLMLGYMNSEALAATVESGYVTFYSRSKQRLWQKGETSGNHLAVVDITTDCDNDAILIKARANGPTCHHNTTSCFHQQENSHWNILCELAAIIRQRQSHQPKGSYIASLYQAGIARIAQKVGEEGVEVALAAVTAGANEIIDEAADLLFHLLILLCAKNIDPVNVIDRLHQRQKDKQNKP